MRWGLGEDYTNPNIGGWDGLLKPKRKRQHDKLVALVDNMLELQKKYHDARMDQDKELYERQIKMVDSQIDRLVYVLYELTEEEVKVVEGHA
jgi:hypothetical protein